MLLKDLGQEQTEPTVIYEDNIAAEKLCKNNVHHSRTKHIDIKHHFIREIVEEKHIEIKHLASTEMLADLLTKALAFPTFSKLRQHIVVPEWSSNASLTSGGVEITFAPSPPELK